MILNDSYTVLNFARGHRYSNTRHVLLRTSGTILPVFPCILVVMVVAGNHQIHNKEHRRERERDKNNLRTIDFSRKIFRCQTCLFLSSRSCTYPTIRMLTPVTEGSKGSLLYRVWMVETHLFPSEFGHFIFWNQLPESYTKEPTYQR